MPDKIFFLCDGEVENCEKARCYKNTEKDACHYTTDPAHAVNFAKKTMNANGAYYERAGQKNCDRPKEENR